MVSTMVQYVVVWFGKTLAWHPIQLLWHGGVLCPEWWEEEEEGREGGRHPPRHGQRRTRRLMCWDIAIKRSSFTTCTMYIYNRVSQKNTFLKLSLALLTTHAIGL